MGLRKVQSLASRVVVRRRIAERAFVKKCANLFAIVLLVGSGFGCICCPGGPLQVCCPRQRADESQVIHAVISATSQGVGCVSENRNCERKKCCLRNAPPNITATIPRLIDNRETASNPYAEQTAFENERPQEVATSAPVMNRGSTYLECCVLRI